LTVDEREIVSRELAAGQTGRQIARWLGRHPSVVNREIQRNGGAGAYRAVAAQHRADAHRARPRQHRLVTNRRLYDAVNAGLGKKWSPRQISRRLREDFPGEDTMRVSHETIYACLYLQAKGQLRTELAMALRQGRAARVPRVLGGRPDHRQGREVPDRDAGGTDHPVRHAGARPL
jgi:IS30 family transposase